MFYDYKRRSRSPFAERKTILDRHLDVVIYFPSYLENGPIVQNGGIVIQDGRNVNNWWDTQKKRRPKPLAWLGWHFGDFWPFRSLLELAKKYRWQHELRKSLWLRHFSRWPMRSIPLQICCSVNRKFKMRAALIQPKLTYREKNCSNIRSFH